MITALIEDVFPLYVEQDLWAASAYQKSENYFSYIYYDTHLKEKPMSSSLPFLEKLPDLLTQFATTTPNAALLLKEKDHTCSLTLQYADLQTGDLKIILHYPFEKKKWSLIKDELTRMRIPIKGISEKKKLIFGHHNTDFILTETNSKASLQVANKR
jgi:hypothetical protein